MVYLTLIRSRWSYDNFSLLWGVSFINGKQFARPLSRKSKKPKAESITSMMMTLTISSRGASGKHGKRERERERKRERKRKFGKDRQI